MPRQRMIRKTLSIFALLIAAPLCSQAEDAPGPDSYELSRAPEWPNRYELTASKSESQSCERPNDYLAAIEELNEGQTYEPFIFEPRQYVDLNFDGVCEVILLQKYTCGTGGCSASVGLFAGNAVKIMGVTSLHFTLLDAKDGWLQMEGWSRGGDSTSRTLYRFNGVVYAVFRTDAFSASEDRSKMLYRDTRYNKYYEQNGRNN